VTAPGALRVRWLGRVPYREALALQTALFERGRGDHLLLLEHPHVFTHGPRADLATNLLVEPESVGAELVAVKRGGDITYHGPGQLVGYPVVNVPNSLGASDHVCAIQRLVVGTLQELGVADVGCLDEYPGVWVGVSGPNPRKICAIGVRLANGRAMHGFALNVHTDLRYMREHIVPCGIGTKPVTSLAEELADEGVEVSLQHVADVVARRAAAIWGDGTLERQDVAWKHTPADLTPFSRGEGPGESGRALARLESAGVEGGLSISTRKPDWLRPKVQLGADVLAMKRTVREHGLVTVCEEAGCPNLSECWASGRRRSWCWVSGARVPAGSVWSTPASRWRLRSTNPSASPRRLPAAACGMRCSRWLPATTSTTVGSPTWPRVCGPSASDRPARRSRRS